MTEPTVDSRIRVLLVEDVEDDALLVIRELKHSGFTPACERVDSEAALLRALADGPWDLVLSDYAMPGFDGRHAFEIVQQRAPEVPFIFVSAKIGEERAVAAIKRGASDYVLKDHLGRLGAAVQRELRESRVRRERRELAVRLEESERRYRSLVEHSAQGIIVHRNDTPLYANEAAARILGFDSPAELVALGNMTALVAPEDRERTFEFARARLEGQPAPEHYEFRALRQDGEMRLLELSGARVDWDGEPALQAAFVDRTERWQAEEALRKSEQRFRDYAGTASDWFWETDAEHRITYNGPAFFAITGTESSDVIGCAPWRRTRDSADPEQRKAHKALLEAQRPFRDFRLTYRPPGRPPVTVSINGTPVTDEDGTFLGYRGTGTDVSAEVAAMARAEEARVRLEAAIEASPTAFMLYDAEERFVTANGLARRLFPEREDCFVPGMSFEETLRALEAANGADPASLEGSASVAERLRLFRRPPAFIDFRNPSGSWIRAYDRKVPGGGTVCIRIDITDVVERERALEESERRFEDFAEIASDWFWETNTDLRYTYFSPRYEKSMGLDPKKLIGRKRTHMAPEDADPVDWERHLEDIEARRPFRDFVFLTSGTGGEPRWVGINGVPTYDDAGNYLGYRGTGRDVTAEIGARKAAEAAREQLEAAIDAMPAGIALYDADDRFVMANRRTFVLFPEREAVYRPDVSFEEVARAAIVAGRLTFGALEGEAAVAERLRLFRDPPEFFEFETGDGRCIRAYDRKIPGGGTICIRLDITDIRQAEAALREREIYLGAIIDNSTDLILIHDPEGRVIFISPSVQSILGFAPADVLGHMAAEFVHPEDRAALGATIEQILAHPDRPARATLRSPHKDGSWRLLEGVGRSLAHVPSVGGVLVTLRDVTEQKQAEQEIASQRRLLRGVIDSLPIWVAVRDLEGRFVLVNRKVSEDTGVAERDFLGRLPPEVPYGTPEERARVVELDRHTMESGEVVESTQVPFANAHGQTRKFHVIRAPLRDADGTIDGLVAVASDITEQVSLTEQLNAAQRMEAVGRLAGGVAHDFNNMLTAIISYSQFLLDDFGPEHAVHADALEIHKAGLRAAELTKQLLAFSRKQVLELKHIDLNDVLQNVENMLRRLIGEDIELIVRPGADLAEVMADPSQIDQIVMNLAVNARDAMPGGGKLVIETANVELDADYAEERSDTEPGPHVMLSVSDTGSGIDAETKAQIFEPFFTTKDQGKGTGLGLSTVYGVVRQSGGNVWVYSEPGKGTTFRIYLPRAYAVSEAPADDGLPRVANKVREGYRVLLVEDDPSVRKVSERMLGEIGCDVLSAGDGVEALMAFERAEGAVDLVLTDVVMPGMSGHDVSERLRALKPELKVLFMSGYTEDVISHHGVLDPGVELISKPFSQRELLKKIDDITHREAAGP